MSSQKSIAGKIYSHFPKKDSVLSITYRTDKIFHTVFDKHIVPLIAYGNNCKIT